MWRIATKKNPKGPSRWETVQFDLSGTKIVIYSPEQHHKLIDRSPPESGLINLNLYDSDTCKRPENIDPNAPEGCGLKYRDWSFYGFLGSQIGDIQFNVELTKFGEFSSLFHPLHLECAIERYIYSSTTSSQVSGQSRLNWKIVQMKNTAWVNYTASGGKEFHNSEDCYQSIWHTPIGDEHIISVEFNQIIRAKNTALPKVFATLIDKVMSNIKIELSQEALRQADDVRRQFPNVEHSKQLPPYEFEEFHKLERLNLVDKLAAQYNYEKDFSSEDIDRALEKQDEEAEKVRRRVMASHLRFKNL